MNWLAQLTLAALAAALAPFGSASADETWTNISRDGEGVSVRRDDEPMIEGSGQVVRQARATGNFDSIHVFGPTRLELVVGPRPSVEIEIDDNLAQLITSRVEGGELRIETRGSFRTTGEPVVRVTVPRIERVKLQGSGDGRIEGVSGGALELVNQGSGNLLVSGRAASVTANLYGPGSADLTRLLASDLSINLYGPGDARVHASEALSAAVYGPGSIAYSGSPRRVRRDVHGPGSISAAGE